MREIKFRVRDQDGHLIGYERLTPKGRWQRRFDDEHSEWSEDAKTGTGYSLFWPQGSETLIREQYTGRKSKSGVEIYEGDRYKMLCGCTGAVKFLSGAFVVSVPLDENNYDRRRYRVWHNSYCGEFSQLHAGEVVGTIHDSTELLEEQG